MSDQNSLRILGLAFAAVTAAVLATAGWVVNAHLAGELTLDPPQDVAEMSASASRQ
jgi:hypothetical protein